MSDPAAGQNSKKRKSDFWPKYDWVRPHTRVRCLFECLHWKALHVCVLWLYSGQVWIPLAASPPSDLWKHVCSLKFRNVRVSDAEVTPSVNDFIAFHYTIRYYHDMCCRTVGFWKCSRLWFLLYLYCDFWQIGWLYYLLDSNRPMNSIIRMHCVISCVWWLISCNKPIGCKLLWNACKRALCKKRQNRDEMRWCQTISRTAPEWYL